MRRIALALLCSAGFPAMVLPQQPDSVPGLQLRLNLPSYRLEVFESGRFIHRYRVSIGDTAYPTPIGRFKITRVEWDPWWVPPPSEWAAADSITRPGPFNPMGRVKLSWRDLYFLHGTPYSASIGAATSHGCVRLRNGDVVALATLVHRYGTPAITADTIKEWAATPGRTRVIELERPVPLEIAYDLVVVRNDTLVVYPDVYHRLAGALPDYVLGVLADAGYDTTLVRRPVLEARLKGAEKRAVLIPVARLMVSMPSKEIQACFTPT